MLYLLQAATGDDIALLIKAIESQANPAFDMSNLITLAGLGMFAAVVVYIVRLEGMIKVLTAVQEQMRENNEKDRLALHARVKRVDDDAKDDRRLANQLTTQCLVTLRAMATRGGPDPDASGAHDPPGGG